MVHRHIKNSKVCFAFELFSLDTLYMVRISCAFFLLLILVFKHSFRIILQFDGYALNLFLFFSIVFLPYRIFFWNSVYTIWKLWCGNHVLGPCYFSFFYVESVYTINLCKVNEWIELKKIKITSDSNKGKQTSHSFGFNLIMCSLVWK